MIAKYSRSQGDHGLELMMKFLPQQDFTPAFFS